MMIIRLGFFAALVAAASAALYEYEDGGSAFNWLHSILSLACHAGRATAVCVGTGTEMRANTRNFPVFGSKCAKCRGQGKRAKYLSLAGPYYPPMLPLPRGTLVEIHGLNGSRALELNGQWGEVHGPAPGGARYRLRLQYDSKPSTTVRPGNVQQLSAEECDDFRREEAPASVSDTDSPEGSDSDPVPPPSPPPQPLPPSPLVPTQPLSQPSSSPQTHRVYRMVCLDCEATLEPYSTHGCSDMRRPPCSAQRVTRASPSFPRTHGRGVLLRIGRGRASWLGFEFGDGWERRRGRFNGGRRSSLGCAYSGDWGRRHKRLRSGSTSPQSSVRPSASWHEWLWVSDGAVWHVGCVCLHDCCLHGLLCAGDGWASRHDCWYGAGCVSGRRR
jgi:hypothetical protein